MKTKNIIFAGILALSGIFASSCIDEEINMDKGAVEKEKLKPEWSLNASISNAQFDPHIAERIFVLSWKAVSRFDRASGATIGGDNNGWMTDYLGIGYGAGWLRDINLAIEVAKVRIDKGDAEDGDYAYYKNTLQICRIWRAHILSELSGNFGPMPTTEAFHGVNPSFESEEAVCKFVLTELEQATKAMDVSISMAKFDKDMDLFYAADVSKWIRFGNSLRMRIAMRVSNVAPELAKTHFEDAAKGPFIETLAETAQVREQDGWSPFAGVMSRSWNKQNMSKTFYNLTVGLGGLEFPVPTELDSKLKDPYTYLGMRLDRHFPTTTNDPSAGYFFDGIPKNVDPRAPLLYHITGYRDANGVYPEGAFGNDGDVTKDVDNIKFTIKLLKEDGVTTDVIIYPAYTWSTAVAGVWDKKGSLSAEYEKATRLFPSLSNKYRTSTNSRVFFAPWETYFLLAEAKLKNWTIANSLTAQQYYEKGIETSFEYHGISSKYPAYIASDKYSRVGTSVAFTHTAEASNYTINYVDGYTKAAGTVNYEYPKNSVYNGGNTNNDALTKIITQKYLAQVPWLPFEAWNDHRRLGLPFFENQAVEVAYDSQTQVPLTPATSKTCSWDYYPKRFRFPISWSTIDPDGFAKTQSLIGGPDKTTTSLWWSH